MNSRVGQAQFVDIAAATQFQGPGALITDDYQKEITDILRRKSVLDGRINYVPATGDISTYYEQNTVNGGDFIDPRNPSATPTSNERTPHGVKIKALTNQVNFGHYDVTLGQQQNNFTELKAKDLDDMLNGIALTHGKALWRGNDTALAVPTTRQYMGIPSQITNTFTVGVGASIVAAIRAKVAAMVGSEKYEVLPTAIYIHPIGHYHMTEEVRLAVESGKMSDPFGKTVVAGLEVPTIMTAAGLLPIIPEPFMPSKANETNTGNTDYGIAIVTESMIEYHYVGEKGIFLFELGTTSNLLEQYVGVKYGAPVAKGPSYAHAYGTIERPTIASVG